MYHNIVSCLSTTYFSRRFPNSVFDAAIYHSLCAYYNGIYDTTDECLLLGRPETLQKRDLTS